MLQSANIRPVYASGVNEPSDFFIEGLMYSEQFDLGLGYFRSTGFKSLAIGFATFLQNGGRMRFIINDSLTEKDKSAILEGQARENDLDYEKALVKDLKELTITLTKRDEHFFNCLSWLISSNRLQIIAVKPKKNKVGIVHHKFGIFTDKNGDQAIFNGSINFSQYAFENNVETIWCEYSWEAQGLSKQRISEMIKLFEDTWEGRSEAVRIIPIEEVKATISRVFPKKRLKELVDEECRLAAELIKHYKKLGADPSKVQEALDKLIAEAETHDQIVDKPSKKWRHQDDAIKKFLKHERGILNMATGTGKTRTALRICKMLIADDRIDAVIVACDGNDLLDQWYKELLKLVDAENLDWVVLRHYNGYYESETFNSIAKNKILLSSRLKLHIALSDLSQSKGIRTLMIHDEVHRLGSFRTREKLNKLSAPIRYRLGLSATPEREYDQKGTEFIQEHIGPTIFVFGLHEAIKRGILSPLNYIPLQYQLTQTDRESLQKVFKLKSAKEKAGTPLSDEEFHTRISNVYKTAEGKIPVFKEFIKAHPQILDQSIIFTETKSYGIKILDIVHSIKAEFHSYFGEDDSAVLSRFSSGEIDCLLTCHRLSEGIDIPSLKNVILISSARARLETIQRIGRCLRLDPKNPSKEANVVDFIRIDTKKERESNADENRQEFLQSLANVVQETTKNG